MSYELASIIAQYGYIAILILVFLQEVGMPSPFPNELLLLLSGYFVFSGALYFPMVILSAIVGDLAAGATLYTLFYFFGQTIIRIKPRWVPVSQKKMERISEKIRTSGQSGVAIGRLSPFIRGYVAVLCGLLRISPRRYGITLLLTTTTWVLSYVTVGFIIAPYCDIQTLKNSNFHLWLLIVAAVIIAAVVVVFVFNLIRRRITTN